MQPASRDQAVAAVRAFHAEHGRQPRWREWERATASRPCAKTIERRWARRELLAVAIGVKPNLVHASSEGLLDEHGGSVREALGELLDDAGWAKIERTRGRPGSAPTWARAQDAPASTPSRRRPRGSQRAARVPPPPALLALLALGLAARRRRACQTADAGVVIAPRGQRHGQHAFPPLSASSTATIMLNGRCQALLSRLLDDRG